MIGLPAEDMSDELLIVVVTERRRQLNAVVLLDRRPQQSTRRHGDVMGRHRTWSRAATETQNGEQRISAWTNIGIQ